MKFNQVLILAGLALVAIALFSLGLPAPGRVKSQYELEEEIIDHIRSTIKYPVVVKEELKRQEVENVEKHKEQMEQEKENKEIAKSQKTNDETDVTVEEVKKKQGEKDPREEVTAPPGPGPAWMPKRNTKPGAVKKVAGFDIEPIDTNTRANLLRMSQKFKLRTQHEPEVFDKAPHKVWIDLGARFFQKGSTRWFTKLYPRTKEFEAHLFDVLDLADTYSQHTRGWFKSFEFHVKAAWTHDKGVDIIGKKMGRVHEGAEKAAAMGDKRQVWKTESVDLGHWIMTNFTKEDWVVVKLDIEGGEWGLLPHLKASGAFEYIDEMFFECHPQNAIKWGDWIPQECVDLTNWLRENDVFCHRWT